MPLDLSQIPVVDHHCHPWRQTAEAFVPETYRPLFTEAVHPRAHEDVPANVYYRWTLRELGRVLGCPPDEGSVLAARAELGHAAFAARLMAEANVEAAILDHLFTGRGADNYSVAQMAYQYGGALTTSAVRLESVLEQLVVACDDLGELEEQFRRRLDPDALAAEGVVSLKSIVAYRTGLDLARPSESDVRAAFGRLREAVAARGRVRIAEKAFLDYFLRIALAWCAEHRFPIQFHTGFGDPDVDLRTGNPLQMREVFQDESLRDAPIVLLHAGYPFVQETGYLANVYPNVYLDLGLAIPHAASEYQEIVRQALALGPSTKVLWSSDGYTIPEHTWFAAVHGRKALARALDDLIGLGAIDEPEALQMAEQILRGNAIRLYGLDALAGTS